jgi:hypothetical protein
MDSTVSVTLQERHLLHCTLSVHHSHFEHDVIEHTPGHKAKCDVQTHTEK